MGYNVAYGDVKLSGNFFHKAGFSRRRLICSKNACYIFDILWFQILKRLDKLRFNVWFRSTRNLQFFLAGKRCGSCSEMIEEQIPASGNHADGVSAKEPGVGHLFHPTAGAVQNRKDFCVIVQKSKTAFSKPNGMMSLFVGNEVASSP